MTTTEHVLAPASNTAPEIVADKSAVARVDANRARFTAEIEKAEAHLAAGRTDEALSLVSEMYFTTMAVRENTKQIGAAFHMAHPVYGGSAWGVFHEAADWRINPMEQKNAGHRQAVG